MAKIILTYFEGRGRAEFIRWILAHAGAQYEDRRLPTEQWPMEKKGTLTGMLPTLTYGDFVLGESLAIGRFLAKECDLVGDSRREEATADMICQFTDDFQVKFKPVYAEPDDDKRAELMKEITYPYFGFLVRMLERNGSSGYLVGRRITYADILTACNLDAMTLLTPEMALPKPLAELKDKVMNIPAIKAWIDKRPASAF